MSKELVKPVEILAEEELQEIESTYGRFNPTLIRMIASHRELLSANAELSFENMKLKDSLTTVKNHLEAVTHPKRFVMLDCPWMLDRINQTLEELK